ncbi:MAG: hypothetical protein ACK5O3_01180 [Burkholderiales bacterium]
MHHQRGKEAELLRFASKDEVARTLLQAIDHELDAAHRKLAEPWYWRGVGALERQAAMQARSCVQAVLASHQRRFLVTSNGLAQRCHAELLKLTEFWRANPDDEDGYGLGTLHAIRRVLEC